MKREAPPTHERPEVEPSADNELDELSNRWLNGELQVTIPTDLVPASAIEHNTTEPLPAAREVLRKLAFTRAGRLITAATLLVAACETRFYMAETAENSADSADTSPGLRLAVTYSGGDIEITLNQDHHIRVVDGLTATEAESDWNTRLPHQDAAGFVELNPTYQMHKAIVFEQYANAIDDDAGKSLAPTTGPLGMRQKYFDEPGRMADGAYPNFDQIYNEMSLGDEAYVVEVMQGRWETAASYLGQDNLENLSAAQWMEVLQDPGTFITYDTRLGSMFDNFDPAYTIAHDQMTIAELLEDGKGVCRDIERINVTSYMLADQQYHLADRGLLYVPVVNISDAGHTRGMFMLALSPTETVVVGVDTTSVRAYQKAETKNSFNVTQEDTAMWYAQQFGKEFMSTPQQVIAAYEAILEAMPDMGPTAKAMLRRETVLAKIAAKDYKGAFTDLQTQLLEERVVPTSMLNIPSRLVPLYELFIVVANEYDKVDPGAARGLHTAVAKQAFADYIAKNNVNPAEAMDFVEQIDKKTGDERTEYVESVYRVLAELDKGKK